MFYLNKEKRKRECMYSNTYLDKQVKYISILPILILSMVYHRWRVQGGHIFVGGILKMVHTVCRIRPMLPTRPIVHQLKCIVVNVFKNVIRICIKEFSEITLSGTIL